MKLRLDSLSRALWTTTLALAWAVPVTGQDTGVGSGYRIAPRDQIQIQVEEMQNLNQEVTVDETGTIELEPLGTVEVLGLTESQLAASLRSRLESRGLRKATVSVEVTSLRTRPVSILGAVGNPGNHGIPGRATLLEMLLGAGGLTSGHGPEIIVRRRAANGLSDEVRIATAELIEVGRPQVNIPIFSGDLISVPPARKLTVHMIGEVSLPGSLTFEGGERATLLTAIARAGGLTDEASKRIRIQRREPSGERGEIVADFRRILNNDEPDVPLQDDDLIIVKESFF